MLACFGVSLFVLLPRVHVLQYDGVNVEDELPSPQFEGRPLGYLNRIGGGQLVGVGINGQFDPYLPIFGYGRL